ncbi:MAG TPA: hypothetical protein VFP97_08855 [Chitinophagaceae bacterium]|nr:hypothetical protein [Chitinophagaceae bacterium]
MSTDTNPTPAPATSGIDGKTISIISYFSLIGWIIAFVLYNNNKSKLAAYHIRQSLGLMIAAIALYIVMFIFLFIPVLGWIISILIYICLIGLFVLWVFGLVAAINGQEKPVPLLGKIIQDTLSGIK